MTWKAMRHDHGVRGHKSTGLTLALDGSEDAWLSREALLFWREAGMGEARLEAIQEVTDRIESGELTSFADWTKLIRHPEDPGVLEDSGDELEYPMEAGEKAWADGAHEALVARDDSDIENMEEGEATGREEPEGTRPGEAVVRPLPGDSTTDIAEAEVRTKRMNLLQSVRSDLQQKAVAVPQALYHIERQMLDQERSLRSGGPDGKRANPVLFRALLDRQAALDRETDKARKRAARHKKAARKESKRTKRAAKAKAEATRLRAVRRLGKSVWATTEFGHKTRGRKARAEALDFLHRHAPPLPDALAALWPTLRDRWAELYPRVEPVDSAVRFRDSMEEVVRKLGTHWARHEAFNRGPEAVGEADAFVVLCRTIMRRAPTGREALAL